MAWIRARVCSSGTGPGWDRDAADRCFRSSEAISRPRLSSCTMARGPGPGGRLLAGQRHCFRGGYQAGYRQARRRVLSCRLCVCSGHEVRPGFCRCRMTEAGIRRRSARRAVTPVIWDRRQTSPVFLEGIKRHVRNLDRALSTAPISPGSAPQASPRTSPGLGAANVQLLLLAVLDAHRHRKYPDIPIVAPATDLARDVAAPSMR